MASTNQTPRTRRHRSAVACRACRQRKVRCSLTVTGVPCAGCTQDAIECIVDKKQRKGTKKIDTPTSHSRHQGHSGAIDSNFAKPAAPADPTPSCPTDQSRTPGAPLFDTQDGDTTRIVNRSTSELEVNNMADEERNGLEIASAALGQPESVGEIPFYTGEQTGPTSALNICSHDHSLPKHFLIPLHRTHLSDEDQDFLRRKGVFTLPSKSACDSMIEAYLVHVHPILPVIEADVLVNHHQAGKLQDYNLLLLWSLFFVAVNFIPATVYEQEGFASRRAMKFTMYSRAKCMYNNGNERNKVVLLQSSLLMGFWHSDMDEHAQPWYWTGTAVNLGQILGLHRDIRASNNLSITDRQRSFWCRLWWSCFFRDRWLGLTLGRPLRINLDDCDIRMPLAADLLFDTMKSDGSTIASYLPTDMNKLAEYWVMLIELSCLLGNVLAINRRPAGRKASLDEVEGLEGRLQRSRLPDQYEVGLTRVARFYSHHVHLHYQAMVITFYRHWEVEAREGPISTAKEGWQHRVRLKADAAASRTNGLLDTLVQEELLGFAGPMTPPLLVPAMQVHLHQCRLGDSLSRRIRLNKLEMCMLVLEEFQKTYTVASIYRGIFTKAIQQIFPGYSTPTIRTSAAATPIPESDTENHVPGTMLEGGTLDTNNSGNYQLDDYGMAIAEETDLMNFFMDEGSIFDFWQTWNQI